MQLEPLVKFKSNQPFCYNNALICNCNFTNDGVCHVVQMYVLLLLLLLFFFFGLNKKKKFLIKVQLFNLCTFTYLQVRISKVSHLVGFWFTVELAKFFFRHKYVKSTRVLMDLSLEVGVAGLKIQIVYNFSPVKILVIQIS